MVARITYLGFAPALAASAIVGDMEPRFALRLPPAAMLVVADGRRWRALRVALTASTGDQAGLVTEVWACVRLIDRAAAGRLVRIEIPHG